MSKTQPFRPFVVLKSTLQYTKSHFLRIYLLAAMVILPASVLRAIQIDSTTDASLLASFAGFFVCLALYRVYSLPKLVSKEKTSVVYVNASARILPYMLATIMFSIILLPMIIGLVLAVLAIGGVTPLWVVLPGILVLVGGGYLAVKSSLTTTIAAVEPASAVTALRASWAISKNNFWRLFLAWLVIFGFLLVISGVLIWLVTRVGAIANNEIALAILNGFLLSLLLPLLVGFATNTYESIDR